MTLTDLLESLQRVAIDFRRQGHNCCAQLAEQHALRLAEAIKEAGIE